MPPSKKDRLGLHVEGCMVPSVPAKSVGSPSGCIVPPVLVKNVDTAGCMVPSISKNLAFLAGLGQGRGLSGRLWP